jgi:hypothetical protein
VICLCLLNCVLDGETPENCDAMCGGSAASTAVVDCGDASCPECS